MRNVLTIFKKEMKDSLRDRRTVVTMVVVPLLAFPVIMTVMARLIASQERKAESRVTEVALVGNEWAPGLPRLAAERGNLSLRTDVAEEDARGMVESGDLDGAIVVDEGFGEAVRAHRTGRLSVYFKATENLDASADRLRDLLRAYEDTLRTSRLGELGLEEGMLDPVEVTEVNVASAQEQMGSAIGGFLPYMFILFCFMGAMHPAIDLGAGEKERGTLETLLTAPATYGQILAGKFGVVVVGGVASAVFGILGMYVGLRSTQEIPQEFLSFIVAILEPRSIALMLSLILPLTVFFGSLQLTLSFSAKSFKEAQSTIQPISILLIIPAMGGLIPGIRLNGTTALVPVLNVALASKEIVSGTVRTGPLVLTYASLVVLAAVGLGIAARFIFRESTIFRT